MSLAQLTLVFLLSQAQGAIPRPCGTLALLPRDGLPPAPVVPLLPPSTEKLERDDYGVTAHEYSTANFVIRWGNSGGVSTTEVERLATAFEAAWTEEIGTQGHPPPGGAETYKFNIYIGDSGGGTPSGYGAGGYFNYDGEGWPMVVVAADTLNSPEFADITAAHEFYHAIQGVTGRYYYDDLDGWFWEATATWASATVYPDNENYAVFLFGYALFPYYPVNFFDYYDTGALQEYFQYGAFIWPWFLTEQVADRELIRDAWLDATSEPDPLEVLRALLDDRGIDLNEAWLDHIAANATWDYPMSDTLTDGVNDWAGSSEGLAMTVAEIGRNGTSGWEVGPAEFAPYRYGSNRIALPAGNEGVYRIEIQGDTRGDARSPAAWGARVVLRQGDSRTVYDLPFDGVEGTLDISGLEDVEEAWLVIGAWTSSNRNWDTETFGYSYRVTHNPEDAGTDGGADGADGATDGGGGTDGGTDGGEGGGPSGDTGAPAGGEEGGDIEGNSDSGTFEGEPAEGGGVKLESGCNHLPGAVSGLGSLILAGGLFRRRGRRG